MFLLGAEKGVFKVCKVPFFIMKGSRQQANIYRLEGSMVVGEAGI